MLAKLLATIAGSLAASLLCGAFARGQEYTSTSELAVKNNLPLIVFLDCEQRGIAGALVCRTQKLPGYAGPAIVVSVPGGDWMHHRATLPATATDAEIMSAISLPAGATDAMDELNNQRKRAGLHPFIRDHSLTLAAANAAIARADAFLAGHTANDFAYLPAGAHADAAGCGAWTVGTVTTDGCTFGTCAADSREYRVGGAAWVMGKDGRTRFMHLFVRR